MHASSKQTIERSGYQQRGSGGHLPVMGQVKRLNIGECRALCTLLEPHVLGHDSYKRFIIAHAGLSRMRLTGVPRNAVLVEFQVLLIKPEILVIKSKAGGDVGFLYAAS